MAPTYWLDLFTATTWLEFLEAGGEVTGFREASWGTVQQIRPGDYLLCYLVVVKRFVGVLEVVSKPFQDDTRIWQDATFPCRLRVKPLVKLEPQTGVPIGDLRDRLSIFTNHPDPRSWGIYVRRSPTKWSDGDGAAVLDAVRRAEADPTSRPVTKGQLHWRPKLLKASKLGMVTVPDSESDSEGPNSHQRPPSLSRQRCSPILRRFHPRLSRTRLVKMQPSK